jgi:NAD(P)-dependent dehydrogenase (short-subunit alcohol dehydrogenase family)
MHSAPEFVLEERRRKIAVNSVLGERVLSRYSPRMDLGLKNKVALVTGGAAGIGAAVVRLLASEGARVTFADRDEASGQRLEAELAGTSVPARFIFADLTREADCQRCVAETLHIFDRLDILINNAGANDGVGLEQSLADFMSSLQKNLFHVFAVTHFAVDALKKSRGAIVNVSSKVALVSYGVRVNCVVPAECDTPQYQRWFESQPNPPEARAMIEKLVPLGRRMTTPEEIAAAILFLASPRSSHTTGQLLFVDGGYTHLDRALTQSGHEWHVR